MSSTLSRTGRNAMTWRVDGFTVLELLMLLLLIAVVLAIASQSYGAYLERTAARRAAELFARDLVVARTAAQRDREPAVLLVLEGSREYLIRKTTGEVLAQRSYGPLSDVRLSLLELDLPGDSIAFNRRGIADLSGAAGPLGEARFKAGRITFQVRFNSTGGSEVSELP